MVSMIIWGPNGFFVRSSTNQVSPCLRDHTFLDHLISQHHLSHIYEGQNKMSKQADQNYK